MPTAIVTGAVGGIGQAICRVLKTHGYTVIGIDRVAGDCNADEFQKMDIQGFHKSKEKADSLKQRIDAYTNGKLDLLVNNAAHQVVKSAGDLTRDDWDETMSTNLSAAFFLTQTFLPDLEAARGSVVNISSVHANLTKPGFVAYATSKGAMVAMTRALAVELGPRGVRVNAILPAATDTPMLRAGFAENQKAYDALGAVHPIGRIAKPDEIAELVAFLASDKCTFMNGSAIAVDGGIGAVLHDP